MTKSTRSNCTDLRGPLPAPTRPRGGKGATNPSRRPPDDDHSAQGDSRNLDHEPRSPNQNTENHTAMDVDELEPECSVATLKRPITPEIRVLSRRINQTPGERARRALEHKELMKFKKNQPGKKQSSNTTNYSDPAKWRNVADLLKVAAGLYQNLN
ncbi:uncharacterized protein PGTG_07839 [Puccinia graminis f. sp. tritici CRL 75-36-700-3]|uniref:Uncharacterized protein n=1 Tax=Puccinia graminis f. sp. tritici (strain CRL 75-36-700-3 / race SCCL) TaxID=418459 RepID=E3KB77_PUCGT|nr:uncharacterized protein PGTG_07839 [Puccinia graminis f. sp. tritici CRL 75-36-700-3]EFP81590.1 hypothetical protein PGTG_07839 [Puccinia graminis f. sp. tritici CRL 75-36-700-3]